MNKKNTSVHFVLFAFLYAFVSSVNNASVGNQFNTTHKSIQVLVRSSHTLYKAPITTKYTFIKFLMKDSS